MATNVSVSRPGPGERLRLAGAGVLAGMVAGLVGGLGARIAMRIVALAAGQRPAFSLGATVAIIVLGVPLGIPIGLLFVATRRFLPGPRLVKGLALGALLLLIFTLPFTAGNEELAIAPLLGTILFSALFLVAGVAAALAEGPIERQLPAPRRSFVSMAGYGVLMALGVAGTLLFAAIVISAIMGVDI